jgi:hypothetical protein
MLKSIVVSGTVNSGLRNQEAEFKSRLDYALKDIHPEHIHSILQSQSGAMVTVTIYYNELPVQQTYRTPTQTR